MYNAYYSILFIFDVTYKCFDHFMKNSKKIDYLLVLIGCIIAIYAQAEVEQNTVILVFGIVILMYGLFRISSTIPHKKNKDDSTNI